MLYFVDTLHSVLIFVICAMALVLSASYASKEKPTEVMFFISGLAMYVALFVVLRFHLGNCVAPEHAR